MASFRGVAERAKLVRSQPAMELSPSPEANGHAVELPSGRPEALPEPSSPVRITGRRGALLRRALAIADMVGLALAFASAQLLFAEQRPEDNEIGTGTEFALFCLTLPGWFLLARVYGLYRRDEERTDHSTADDLVTVFHLVTVGAWGYFALAWLTPLADPFPPKFLTFWALAIVLVSGGRAVARAVCRRRAAYLQNTIILGAGHVGQLVAESFFATRSTV